MDEVSCTTLDLVRHGEHELGNVLCGVTDPRLTELGWSQLRQRSDALLEREAAWSRIHSSPRLRCADFASELGQRLGLDPAIDDHFAEVDFGEWEGLSFDQVSERFPGMWQAWIRDHDQPAPHGGESYGHFLDRVQVGLETLLADQRGERILLLAHGGVIRALLRCVLQLEPGALNRFNVPHACHVRLLAYHAPQRPDWVQLDRYDSWL